MVLKQRAACAALVVFALVGAGCQSVTGPSLSSNTVEESAPAQPTGFTCCNLNYTEDWISDANYGGQGVIPLGTPAKVTGYGRFRVAVTINNKPMRLGLDYGRAESLEAYAAKVIVTDDPKIKVASFPANVQTAIKQSQVMAGMTKEQVIMSLGYPLTNENPDLNRPIWRYWLSSFDEYQIVWDGNGRVKEVIGAPTSLSRVVFRP